MAKSKKITKKIHKICIVDGVAGTAIYLNDFRIAGPKPWGGGDGTHEGEGKNKKIRNSKKQNLLI